jgi:hypothetical protein
MMTHEFGGDDVVAGVQLYKFAVPICSTRRDFVHVQPLPGHFGPA